MTSNDPKFFFKRFLRKFCVQLYTHIFHLGRRVCTRDRTGKRLFWAKWSILKVNEPSQPAHEMNANDMVNSNIEKKIGQNWPYLALIGPKWPKMTKTRRYESHAKLHIKSKLMTWWIQMSKKFWSKLAQIGQNGQKMAKTQHYKIHAKLHIKWKLTTRKIQLSK